MRGAQNFDETWETGGVLTRSWQHAAAPPLDYNGERRV